MEKQISIESVGGALLRTTTITEELTEASIAEETRERDLQIAILENEIRMKQIALAALLDDKDDTTEAVETAISAGVASPPK